MKIFLIFLISGVVKSGMMCYNVTITFVGYRKKLSFCTTTVIKKETKKMTAKRKNRGFTLIELLVGILRFG